MVSENPVGYLTLRAGTFQRSAHAIAPGVDRAVSITNCPVTEWMVMAEVGVRDDHLHQRSFSKGQAFQLHIFDSAGGPLWANKPEKMGALIPKHTLANIYVPHAAFADFWTTAGAVGGSPQSIELELKPSGSDFLDVTNVGLFETEPPLPAEARRIHPVVAELRNMRERLTGFARLVVRVLNGRGVNETSRRTARR